VGAERDASAKDHRGHLHRRVEIGEGASGQDRSGGNTDERVNRVPGRINGGNLVGDEFDQV